MTKSTRPISKSKLMAFLQCEKRFWLELNKPNEAIVSAESAAIFKTGHEVGEKARQIYDPKGKGETIDLSTTSVAQAIAKTQTLLGMRRPIFEAGFEADGVRAFADVLLPVTEKGQKKWRMIEVKSSSTVKDYYRNDIAVQAFVAQASGLPLASVALAHIDTSWTYEGDDDYSGLLKENDLTQEAFGKADEVVTWVRAAQAVAAKRNEPSREVGDHCTTPYECGFIEYCSKGIRQAKHPVDWLPRKSAKLKKLIKNEKWTDMRNVPDDELNDVQKRVKSHTLAKSVYFDKASTVKELSSHGFPAYFLDFETVNSAVPVWKNTRPFQQVPFQFSLHTLNQKGKLAHHQFLDLSGNDPSRAFAKDLIANCGTSGPIFAYNAKFESSIINSLSLRFPTLSKSLHALVERLVDLLLLAQKHYYHPSQKGSWSIKAVLPTIAPDLDYGQLVGVRDGGMAMEAFGEAIAEVVSSQRKQEIHEQLVEYCKLDTFAMVKVWQHFSGKNDMELVGKE